MDTSASSSDNRATLRHQARVANVALSPAGIVTSLVLGEAIGLIVGLPKVVRS